jgi:hypothetical protein
MSSTTRFRSPSLAEIQMFSPLPVASAAGADAAAAGALLNALILLIIQVGPINQKLIYKDWISAEIVLCVIYLMKQIKLVMKSNSSDKFNDQ